MLASILGKRLRWTLPSCWIFEPAIVGPTLLITCLRPAPTPDGMQSSTFGIIR